ncbi:MAG TPA: DNA-directed RNA polymerase subunit B'' [Candidatus Nanoarchaeia archaeon]|nr:DNA-directed RNA polymerase subunit B'' [Candidatus Nanoarchaeia archaeon]
MLESKKLVKKYFEEKSLVSSNIQSFNNFIERELSVILEENKIIEPTIIPHNVDDFKIRLDKIWITEPEITEADGSKRKIFPAEARVRKLTYAAPIFIDISAHINGIQRETFTAQIGNLPIMLKSKFCYLNKLNKQELIAKGEDPNEPGGYFIINGTEKVLVNIEDLAANKLLVEKATLGVSEYIGKLFSEKGSFKIPHQFERLKDGIFYTTFTRLKRVPTIVVLKALGMLKDDDIMSSISEETQYDEIIVNLIEFNEIKSEEDAMDYLAKKAGITQAREIRVERMAEMLDKYLLPHLGIETNDRLYKAKNICKYLRQFIMTTRKEVHTDEKDHYVNKRVKMSGDLLADLFRVNLKVLIGDVLYNFQRIVKRGKFPSIKVIIRDKLLTQRIYSSMATGTWVGGRKGISQRIQRLNYLETLSHLQRVVSPLSTSQENFEARELHPTHLGRLCPVETPEGTNIGLRKNLAMLSEITEESSEKEIMDALKQFGVKVVQ